MFNQRNYVTPGVEPPDTLEGSPSVQNQSLGRMTVVYRMSDTDFYLLKPEEGSRTETDSLVYGSYNGSMSPFGMGAHGGMTLAPGTSVLVLKTALTGWVSGNGQTSVYPIIAVDSVFPSPNSLYYPIWNLCPPDEDVTGSAYNDEAIRNYQYVQPTDRLRGKPVDSVPGDWEIGNPFKGHLYVGSSRIGVEASRIASLHMYPYDSTVVFNKGLLSVEDHPWSRRSETLDVDGLSLTAEHAADTVNDAMGHEPADTTTFTPNTMEPPVDTQIKVDAKEPRWSTLDYRGLSVSGDVRQRMAQPGSVQPAVFSFNGSDGTFLRGGMNSMTLMRSPDLPYLQMLRELDSEEPEEDVQPVATEDDPSAVDIGDYATQYADLMYELMKRRFVERYWARQKARGKDWKALSMSEVAEAMARNPDGLSLNPIGPDEPAYKDDSFTIADPLGQKDLKLSKLESYIHLSPTGAVVISDGTGSEIRMEGGNIILSPSVDIRIQPGRDMTMTIPRFLSMFAKERIDLASDKGEIAVHAAGNATLSSENGVATIESRSTNRAPSAAYDRRGEGGGVVIRSATDTHVLGSNIRLSLQSSTDRSRNGVTPVPDGMITIDAGDSPLAVNGRSLSFHGNVDASVSVGNDGTGLMLGREGVSVAGKVFTMTNQSVIVGGPSTMRWIDTSNKTIQSVTMPAPTEASIVVKGNVVASKNMAAQSVVGSRGLFRALSAFTGKDTESLFVPQKMRPKYEQTIRVYSEGDRQWPAFTVDLSSALVANWFSRNATNPMLTADGVRRLGIYYPKSADYHQDGMFWTQSRWQRLLENTGTAWSPTPVKDADEQPMLPLPGYDGWTRDGFVKGWNADGEITDSTLSNWVTNSR